MEEEGYLSKIDLTGHLKFRIRPAYCYGCGKRFLKESPRQKCCRECVIETARFFVAFLLKKRKPFLPILFGSGFTKIKEVWSKSDVLETGSILLLAQGIIVRAMQDANGKIGSNFSFRPTEKREIEKDAIQFLFGKEREEDLVSICRAGGLNHRMVRKEARKMLGKAA